MRDHTRRKEQTMQAQEGSLAQLHDTILVRLGIALGNVRLVTIGAPFAEELVRVVEGDLLDALQAVHEAERVTRQIAGLVAEEGDR
jgi:hypothetical protein